MVVSTCVKIGYTKKDLILVIPPLEITRRFHLQITQQIRGQARRCRRDFVTGLMVGMLALRFWRILIEMTEIR